MKTRNMRAGRPLALVLALGVSFAAHGAEDPSRLGKDLTPAGGEKAASKDGSIPAWSGGYTKAIPGDKPGGRRGDPK